MNSYVPFLLSALSLTLIASFTHAATISFSGYDWIVKSGTWGPGPNVWNPNNVWVDNQNHLHLKISLQNGVWTTGEVILNQRLGFGTYQFKVLGRPDLLDGNMVLGLFNYTEPDIGPDGTNEIDIEFATWGNSQSEHGNWVIWPALAGGPTLTQQAFDATLTGNESTHRFNWLSQKITFQALRGFTDSDEGEYYQWIFAPTDYLSQIPQYPLPVHINFWLVGGKPPLNNQEAEMIITEFKFIAEAIFSDGFEPSK